jgi:hypothetical protein
MRATQSGRTSATMNGRDGPRSGRLNSENSAVGAFDRLVDPIRRPVDERRAIDWLSVTGLPPASGSRRPGWPPIAGSSCDMN